MPRSYGEIMIVSGALTQALTSTAAALGQFSGAGGSNGTQLAQRIQPDKANNRLKVLPGVYLLDAFVEFTADAEADITLRARRNSVADANFVATDPTRQTIKTFSPTLSPALIAQGTAAESAALTVTGLLTTDKLLSVVKPTNQAGLGIGGARISAADTLRINFLNIPVAGGNITPTAGETYTVTVARFMKQRLHIFGMMNVLTTDVPGTLSLFADPSGANAGASGAPKSLVPIDITLESSANTTITISQARLAMTSLDD